MSESQGKLDKEGGRTLGDPDSYDHWNWFLGVPVDIENDPHHYRIDCGCCDGGGEAEQLLVFVDDIPTAVRLQQMAPVRAFPLDILASDETEDPFESFRESRGEDDDYCPFQALLWDSLPARNVVVLRRPDSSNSKHLFDLLSRRMQQRAKSFSVLDLPAGSGAVSIDDFERGEGIDSSFLRVLEVTESGSVQLCLVVPANSYIVKKDDTVEFPKVDLQQEWWSRRAPNAYRPQRWRRKTMAESEAERRASEQREQGEVPLLRGDPMNTARRFLYERGLREPHRDPSLVTYQGEFFKHDVGQFRQLKRDDLRARLFAWLDRQQCRGPKGVEPFKPKTQDVNQAVDAIGALTHASADIEPPCWSPTAPLFSTASAERVLPPNELVPFTNGLYDLRRKKLIDATPSFFNLSCLNVSRLCLKTIWS